MALKLVDAEKAQAAYRDDPHDRPRAYLYPHHGLPTFGRKSRWRWITPSIIILALLIVLLDALPVAQIPLHATWNQNRNSSAGDAFSTGVEHTHGTGVSTSNPMKASAAASGEAKEWHGTEIEGLPIGLLSESELSVLDNTPGVSLAASVDPDGNRQLFDLSSTGTVRLRKSAGKTTSWTEPEVVPLDPKPKANSPMAALAWKGSKGASNVRLYYLDANSRIVEYASTACATATPCKWFRNTYFTATSSGGLSAIWMGDYDGLRLFYLNSQNVVAIQQWFQGSWRVYSTGLTAARGSSLPTYSISNSSGTVNAIYVLSVDATGSLKELVWDRAVDYSRFFNGRTVDADFKATQGDAAFATAFGVPEQVMRAFFLDTVGPRERVATSGQQGMWTDGWWHITGSRPAATKGGAITSIGYGGEEVRIYYMSGGAILEVGLSMSIGNWWCGNYIA